jgi:hypothetical protein
MKKFFLASSSYLVFVAAWMPVVAQDAVPTKDISPEAAAEAKFWAEFNERQEKITAENLPKWWYTFQDPNAGEAELSEAVGERCSYCAGELCKVMGYRGPNPERPALQALLIRDALVRRGLRYKDSDSRGHFVFYIDVLMADRPEWQLPLLRDALNDPDELVRRDAIDALETWVILAYEDDPSHRIACGHPPASRSGRGRKRDT